MGTLRASVKRFSRACTTLFALSADRSNSQSDFCGKGPLFLERVTYTVVNLIDNYYTNAHEELHRYESDIGVERR